MAELSPEGIEAIRALGSLCVDLYARVYALETLMPRDRVTKNQIEETIEHYRQQLEEFNNLAAKPDLAELARVITVVRLNVERY